VRDCPGTLVHEFTGVQVRVEYVQVVVQVVAKSGVVVVPRKMATVRTARSAARVKSLRIGSSFLCALSMSFSPHFCNGFRL
jgi:hypothetical protein